MDFVYFLGRFHVLALHLPIGIIVALCVLEILSRKERYRYLEAASPYLWGATALSALLTVLLGFMHFAEGSFTGPSAEQHRFFGTVVAVVATVVALLRVSSLRRPTSRCSCRLRSCCSCSSRSRGITAAT